MFEHFEGNEEFIAKEKLSKIPINLKLYLIQKIKTRIFELRELKNNYYHDDVKMLCRISENISNLKNAEYKLRTQIKVSNDDR